MKITAHVLVKNEENFVWFAVNSILNDVDKMVIWDTGSQDNTVGIVKSFKSPKVIFEEKGPADPYRLAALRNEMIKATDADWIFVLDGDEIWFEEGIKEIRELINKYGDSKDLIVSPVKMLIGDIFHYQEEKAGKYRIKGETGHLNIRAIRNFPGLKVKGFFPNEGYMNKNNVFIQNLPDERIVFAQKAYLHVSHLERSRKNNSKFKYELGIPFPKDYYYPEVLFKEKPSFVPSPWQPISREYRLRAFWETPLKKIKRRI